MQLKLTTSFKTCMSCAKNMHRSVKISIKCVTHVSTVLKHVSTVLKHVSTVLKHVSTVSKHVSTVSKHV